MPNVLIKFQLGQPRLGRQTGTGLRLPVTLTLILRTDSTDFMTGPFLLSISVLWPTCVADADIIFLPCGFYLLLLYGRPIGGPLYFCPVISIYLLSIFLLFFRA